MPVHGIDNGNNKHEVYTTEELLSILQQAIISGSLQGIDPEKNPIVAAIRESHNNSDVTFWSGTEAEFNELVGVTSELVGARIGSDGKLYILTGDTTLSDTVEAARQAALEATEGMKREVISVTLLANAWSNTAPYTQTVAVAGMTADKDFLAPYVVPTGNESDDLAAQVALSCISGGTTDTDSVTFYCYDEKPTTTITVFMVDKGTKIESGDFPIASKTAPGIMKVGDGLDVDENGEVSLDEQSVVDETARSEIEALKNPEPFDYTFLYSSSNAFGNCLVMHGDKNVIIDFGGTTGVIEPYLVANGITKIHAIVLTHYHDDHVGGTGAAALEELINSSSIDLDDCIAYLPHRGIDWTQVTGTSATSPQANEIAVKTLLNNAGITIVEPINEQIVDFGSFKMQFFNIGSEFYSQYYGKDVNGDTAVNTDYNAFCMCAKVTRGGVNYFETGDITFLAQKANAKYLTDIDIYHSFHHGVYTPVHKDWALKLNPKYCIVTPNNSSLTVKNPDVAVCGMKGATILNVKEASQNLTIRQIGDELSCNSAVTSSKLNMGVSARAMVMLESGTDLDDLVDEGTYYIGSGAIALTMDNLPPCSTEDSSTTGHSFRIDVIGTAQSESNRHIRQILRWNNLGSSNIHSGVWERAWYGTDSGWSKWHYTMPTRTEGSQNIGGLKVYGYVGDSSTKLFLSAPLSQGIPTSLKITNAALTGLNIRGISGVVAYASTAAQIANFNLNVNSAVGPHGLQMEITKADGTAFNITNETPLAGNIALKFDLEKY